MDESIIQRAMESRDPAAAEEAIKEIDNEILSPKDAKQTASLLLNKAVLNGILRRFSDSRQQLDLALEQAPGDPDIRLQCAFIAGTLYDHEERPNEAYKCLTLALSTHRERLETPDLRFMYEDIQLRRGLDAARIGKFKDALPLLQESLSFDLEAVERSSVLANLGLCHVEMNNYESARDCLTEALRAGPTKDWEGQVHFYLGMSYAGLKQFREAKHEFEICEERLSEYGFPARKIYAWLSWVCKGLGQMGDSDRYAKLARPV